MLKLGGDGRCDRLLLLSAELLLRGYVNKVSDDVVLRDLQRVHNCLDLLVDVDLDTIEIQLAMLYVAILTH